MRHKECLNIMRKIDSISSFIDLYLIKKRDYNTGESFYQTEVHMLEIIVENRDITVSEIAKKLLKTKSSVSQIIKKLNEKGLIVKSKNSDDLRSSSYEITEKGFLLYYAHRNYDNNMAKILEQRLSHFSDEDLYKIEEFLDIFKKFQLDTSGL